MTDQFDSLVDQSDCFFRVIPKEELEAVAKGECNEKEDVNDQLGNVMILHVNIPFGK